MGRARRPWAALVALALAPFTLAGGGMESVCGASVDLDTFATAAEATAALQDAIDASDDCMGEHVVEITGDVTLTAPLVHRYPVPVVLRGVGDERSVLSGGGEHRILVVDPVGLSGAADLTLEHVELRDGRADVELGPNDYIDGGAVWAPEGAGIVVTVRDAIVADNVALEAGGAIAADDVVLEDVAVVGNTAELGGALSVATLVARRTTFEGNGTVGAEACGATEVTVCRADAAVSTLEGGAVRAGLSMVLENVTFHDNQAAVGGAIWMDASPVVTELELGASEVERGIDATFVTFVANAAGGAAGSGAHVAGVDTDGFGPVDLVTATFRASLFLDAVVLDDGLIVIEEVATGLDCSGLAVAVDGATGSRTAGPGCPGTAIVGTAATLLDGPDDHGGVGRTFLPAATVVPAGAVAPASGGAALVDAVDCSVGTWPDEDQRGVERPQGEGCEVGAVELEVDDGPVEDPRDDERSRSTSPVPMGVPSGIGPPSPWWRWPRG